MAARKNPPLIFVGALSNRIWCATRYTKGADAMFTAHEKFDVTDMVGAALAELDRRGLVLEPKASPDAWTCVGCGATTGRYDNGEACETCVMASFAEGG